jgi:hypothetical protein
MNILEINSLNGNVIGINSIVPDFLEIKNGINGVGIFTKKPFKKGEVVYSTNCFALPIDNLTEEIKIRTNIGEFMIIKDIHTTENFLYGWDCFVNHNCNCNLKDFDEYEKDGQAFYSKIAIRDIEVGDELYVNYNEFVYDFEGKGVFKCSCGYEYCHGEIKGFKYVSKENQNKILEQISDTNRNYFLEKLNRKDI